MRYTIEGMYKWYHPNLTWSLACPVECVVIMEKFEGVHFGSSKVTTNHKFHEVYVEEVGGISNMCYRSPHIDSTMHKPLY